MSDVGRGAPLGRPRTQPAGRPGRRLRSRLRSAAQRLAPVLLVTGLLALVAAAGLVAFRFETVVIPNASMEPTFRTGDHVLLDRGRSAIRRGDVVLFEADDWRLIGSPYELKRVVAVGGDQVSCCDAAGQLRLNGQVLTEPYLRADDGTAPVLPFDVIVPAGRLFVLGDNRPDSSDSRAHLELDAGTVSATAVTGRAVAIFLPFGRAAPVPAEGERDDVVSLWQLVVGLAAGGLLSLLAGTVLYLRR